MKYIVVFRCKNCKKILGESGLDIPYVCPRCGEGLANRVCDYGAEMVRAKKFLFWTKVDKRKESDHAH